MYVPHHFAEERLDVLQDLMRRHDFATVVSNGVDGDGPFASHVPVVLQADRGRLGTLQFHLAIANPHVKQFASAATSPVLAIFHGPHCYVSPTWYETKVAVPTWNYLVVHAYGRPRQLDDVQLRAHLVALTQLFEQDRWSPERQLPAEVFDKMRRAIVGFEIEIDRLEGKWKLNQNRTHEDRQGVIAGLRSVGQLELAQAMEASLSPSAQNHSG